MNDTQSLIGYLADAHAERDAIHVAVIPVLAQELLQAADRVDAVGRKSRNDAVGVVDPFLRGAVNPGQRFWMFLFPNTIQSLRHEWSHPAFPVSPKSADSITSEEWLRTFASEHDVTYEALLSAIAHGGCFGDEIYFDREVPPEVFAHARNVGVVLQDGEFTFFRCAC